MHLTDELERKVIALFALGNSYPPYVISLSNGTLNAVTDKLLPELQAWHERDLEAICPIVWLNAIYYKIRERQLRQQDHLHHPGAEYRGQERVAGTLPLRPGRGASLAQCPDLHNRGVKDTLNACLDGLKGFPEAIESIYPIPRSSTASSTRSITR